MGDIEGLIDKVNELKLDDNEALIEKLKHGIMSSPKHLISDIFSYFLINKASLILFEMISLLWKSAPQNLFLDDLYANHFKS